MANVRRDTYRNGVLVSSDTVEVPDEVLTERELTSRAEDVLVEVRAVAASTGNPTGTQVRTLARALVIVLRLVLRRFDGMD